MFLGKLPSNLFDQGYTNRMMSRRIGKWFYSQQSFAYLDDEGKGGPFGDIWARFGAVFGCSGVMGVSDGPPRLRVGVLT